MPLHEHYKEWLPSTDPHATLKTLERRRTALPRGGLSPRELFESTNYLFAARQYVAHDLSFSRLEFLVLVDHVGVVRGWLRLPAPPSSLDALADAVRAGVAAPCRSPRRPRTPPCATRPSTCCWRA